MKKYRLVVLAVVLSFLLHICLIGLGFIFIKKGLHKTKLNKKHYFVDIVVLPKNKNRSKENESHKIASNISKKANAKKFSKKEKLPAVLAIKKKRQSKTKNIAKKKGNIKSNSKTIKPFKIKGELYNKNYADTYNKKVFQFGESKYYKYKNTTKEATVSIGTQSIKYASYLKHIKDKVQNTWVYPEEARLNNQQGGLLLIFTIEKNGDVSRVKVINSSGYRLLDEAAVNAIKEAAPFPPLPKRLHIDRLNIYATFLYKLTFYYVK